MAAREEVTFDAKNNAYSRSTSDVRFCADTASVLVFRLFLTVAGFERWGITITFVASSFLFAHLPSAERI